jgi:hypothetical protein
MTPPDPRSVAPHPPSLNESSNTVLNESSNIVLNESSNIVLNESSNIVFASRYPEALASGLSVMQAEMGL